MNPKTMATADIAITIKKLADELERRTQHKRREKRKAKPSPAIGYENEVRKAFDIEATEGYQWMTATEIAEAIGIHEPSRSEATTVGHSAMRVVGGETRKSNGKKYRHMPPLRVRP